MTKKISTKSSLLNQSTTISSKASYKGGERQVSRDTVLVEQPLQITLNWFENAVYHTRLFSIIMRTPGKDKCLITGLLIAEGIIKSYGDIESLSAEISENQQEENSYENIWLVRLTKGIFPQLSTLEQYQLRYSSCGLCGTTSLKSLELKEPPILNNDAHWLNSEQIQAMSGMMRKQQILFNQTGGSHAAALFEDNVSMVDVQEDIGRHNALDKLIGALLIRNKDIANESRCCIVISSRISFELIQKTVMAGIPVLIAVGAPSDLAITAAKRFDLTLIGFVSNKSFNVYCGDWRVAQI